ncbi:MAG: hypothetical protein KAI55_04000, partial [Candidatus Aenigmarchaeota archaeon]|nr:hypothetical protein [Candidatus Aenigmarchaeota archaeon]
MKVVNLISLSIFLILSFLSLPNLCFAAVSNTHVFPQFVTQGEDVAIITSVRINDAATESCDLTKNYNFYYEYNYSHTSNQGSLSEMEAIYPNANNKIKLYGVSIKAQNNSNLTVYIECTDVFNPELQHLEEKTHRIMTGQLEFPYADDEFVAKNKPGESIKLYPYEIIALGGRNMSEDEIESYQVSYSLYNLYTDNLIERRIFQKPLDLYYYSPDNSIAFGSDYPIGYIVFEGTNNTFLGGKHFPYYAIPYSFSLIASKNFYLREELLALNIDSNVYYNTFPNSVSVEIIKPDNNKETIILENNRNYAGSYFLNQTGIYNMIATAYSESLNFTYYFNKSILVVEPKSVVIETDKEMYYNGETMQVNAVLLETGIEKASSDVYLRISSQEKIYYETQNGQKINNSWVFSIPLYFNFTSNTYTIFISMKDENQNTHTQEKHVYIYENEPMAFAVMPQLIDEVFDGQKITKKITVSNIGGVDISSINIDISSNLSNIVSSPLNSFSLKVSDSREVSFNINPTDFSKKEIEGEIYLTSGDISKKIIVKIKTNIFYSAILDKEEYSIECIVDESSSIELKLKNTCYVPLNDISFSVSEELNQYFIDSSIPETINAGDEGSMYFNFDNFYEENTVTGTIDIISNNITNTATLNIIIIANLSDSINNIIYKKEELALRLSNLNSADEKDALITIMETMQLDISELNSDYSNKKYLDAKEKIALIELDMYSLEEAIRSLEQSELPSNDSHYCGDGVCNADENEEVCVEDCTSESSTTDPPV